MSDTPLNGSRPHVLERVMPDGEKIRVLKVAPSTVMAAKMIVDRAKRGVGPQPSEAIVAIANAHPA